MAKNEKKTYAPTIKFWASKSGKTHTSYVTDKSLENIQNVLSLIEPGGLLMLKPTGENYRAAIEAKGDTPPEFELVIQTAAEVAEFRSSRDQQSDSL